MDNAQEAIHNVIKRRILPWVERDGIGKLILPEQITPADCAKPMKCHRPPWWVSRHQELMVGLTGKAPYCIDNKTFIFTPGRILLLPGGIRRGPDQTGFRVVEDIDPNQPSSGLWVWSYTSGAWVQLFRVVPGRDRLDVTQHYLLLGRHYGRLTSNLLEEIRSGSPNYARISRCILMEFWERCLEGISDPATGTLVTIPRYRSISLATGRSISLAKNTPAKGRGKPVPKRVRIAMEFIHSHYRMPNINLDNIADAVDSSVNHLGRQFKDATGMTPIAYLLEVRMEAARQMLMTDMKIFEVAYLVGIESPTYFSKVFLNSNGITPRQYRRKMLKKANSATSKKAK